MTLKQEYAIVHYIKSGCDLNTTIQSFPGKLSKQTLQKYLRNPECQEYIQNMNSKIEETLKINKTKVVAEAIEIQQTTKQQEDYKTSLQALKQVSQMMGYDAPTEINANIDLSSWLVQEAIDTEVIE